MPGMSPRMKAKKGRFGLAGLTPPTVQITSPATGGNGARAGSPLSVSLGLVGTASDDLQGNVSSQIVWTSSLDAALGTGASITATLTTIGVHTITATITVGGEVATDTITYNVTA